MFDCSLLCLSFTDALCTHSLYLPAFLSPHHLCCVSHKGQERTVNGFSFFSSFHLEHSSYLRASPRHTSGLLTHSLTLSHSFSFFYLLLLHRYNFLLPLCSFSCSLSLYSVSQTHLSVASEIHRAIISNHLLRDHSIIN